MRRARCALRSRSRADASVPQSCSSRSRGPTRREAAVLLNLFEEQRQRFANSGLNPWELAAGDPEHPPELPEGTSAAELAAWTAVARVLLNLDETITKE